MQVFKAFFKTVLAQKSSILIYLGIFVGLSIFLTNMQPDSNLGNFSAEKVDIAVFDYDDSEYSNALYNYLDRTQNIIDIADNKETIADELFFRNVSYVLTIKDGFATDFTQLENIKQSNSASGQFLDSSIEQYLNLLNSCISAGYSPSEAIALTEDAISDCVETKISSTTSLDTSSSSTNVYFGFIPYIFISIFTICLGFVLNVFRRKELSDRIQCSSLSIIKRNLSMTIASLLLCIGIWALMVLVALILFNDVLFTATGILYILNSFVFMIVALSITYMVSFFVHSDSSLNMVANVIGLGLSFLSGIFVPLEYLSDTVINVAKFLPTYWYVIANKLATSYDGSSAQLNTFLSYIGIELLFAVALFTVSLATSKIRKTA